MKKLIIFLFVCSTTTVYADTWFEKDIASLPKKTKAEIVKMYDDIQSHATKMRMDIVKTSDNLAKNIENKADKAKQTEIIDELTRQIVALNNDMRMSYTKLSDKAGSLSKKFEEEKAGDDDADDFYNKIFTTDNVADIYELIDDSGLPTPTKKQIMAQYGNKIRQVKNNFRNAYNKYRGFWMAGITSGTDFKNAENNFYNAVKSMINLSVEIYTNEIAKLNDKQIKALSVERQKVTNRQLNKLNEKLGYIKVKTKSRLNSIEQ